MRSETGKEEVLPNPQSAIFDPAFMQRVRWRSRRGLLELDIVLGRFVEQHYEGLDDAGRMAFDVLLDMPDTELWDMITGKVSSRAECRVILEMLQAV